MLFRSPHGSGHRQPPRAAWRFLGRLSVVLPFGDPLEHSWHPGRLLRFPCGGVGGGRGLISGYPLHFVLLPFTLPGSRAKPWSPREMRPRPCCGREGPGCNSLRVLRGGSWNNNPRNCRSANRNRNNPDNRNDNNGFRVAVLAAGVHLRGCHRRGIDPGFRRSRMPGAWSYASPGPGPESSRMFGVAERTPWGRAGERSLP